MDDQEKCYLCGSTDGLTDDHLPPVSFFPEPRPSNLITARCCRVCNESYSLDDEAFRIFASSLITRSQAGKWIWKNKVMGSSFKRSPKLKENVAKHLVKVPVKTKSGAIQMAALSIPRDRAIRFLVRLTKGLISKFYSDKNYLRSLFEVTHLQLNQENIDYLNKSALYYDERGDCVFRFWYGMAAEIEAIGVWAYVFYDAALFMVSVDQEI